MARAIPELGPGRLMAEINHIDHRVLAELAGHIGAGRGIHVIDLARDLGVRRRLIRASVSRLRNDGIAVCATPREGYYLAATEEELARSCEFLRARALHSLTLESRLRKIPLPDLIGQLKLPT